MPTIERYKGFRFFFFSNEGTEPPHVHVESADKWAKFWLKPVSLEDSGGFNASELTKLRRLVEDKKQQFEESWNEYFSH